MTFHILISGFTLYSNAQENTGTISGRVVDITGHPVPKLPIYVAPLGIGGGFTSGVYFPEDYSKLHRTQTDGVGRFTITGIPSGSFYFGVFPFKIDKRLTKDFEKNLEDYLSWNPATYHPDYIDVLTYNNFGMYNSDFEPDVEIQSLHFQDITFYHGKGSDNVSFGIEPGSHIKDIKIVVNHRMRVQGRVLFKDGKPLANARLSIGAKFRHESGSGGTAGNPWTDEYGDFNFYLKEKVHTGFYTITVKYQNLEVTADPIQLAPGDRLDGLQFTFDSNPIPPKPLPPKFKTDTGKSKTQPKQAPQPRPESNEVWIVNPVNRHAYKRVLCETLDDAIVQATEEKAHLVTINDAKEQKWLNAVFGNELYWIGLSDSKQEGKWQWQNGEPVTYQNWLPDDYFTETWDADERDIVVTSFVDGKWYAVSPNSVIVSMTKMAIIEKADLKINISKKIK